MDKAIRTLNNDMNQNQPLEMMLKSIKRGSRNLKIGMFSGLDIVPDVEHCSRDLDCTPRNRY